MSDDEVYFVIAVLDDKLNVIFWEASPGVARTLIESLPVMGTNLTPERGTSFPFLKKVLDNAYRVLENYYQIW